MNMINPFESPGHWLKASLHNHSSASDGTATPARLVWEYAQHGYDVVVIADHWAVAKPEAELPGNILFIPGIELDCDSPDHRTHAGWHILGIGIDAMHLPERGAGPQELLDSIRDAGGLVVIAHPYWLGLSHSALRSVDGYIAIEVYNGVCDWLNGKGLSAVQWDDLLQRGQRVTAIAVDDCHVLERDFGKAWTMIKARELSQEAVKDALLSGAFYSTQGPIIEDLRMRAGMLRLSCTPVVRINLVGATWMGRTATAKPGEYLTQFCAAVPVGSTYVRVECIDERGRIAWSNPISINP